MRNVVIALVIVLAVFHQDFWLWDDASLVFGFLPIGLAYHILFSLMAGLVWAMAVRFAWPTYIEKEAQAYIAMQSEESDT
jgi:hypothetical protein